MSNTISPSPKMPQKLHKSRLQLATPVAVAVYSLPKEIARHEEEISGTHRKSVDLFQICTVPVLNYQARAFLFFGFEVTQAKLSTHLKSTPVSRYLNQHSPPLLSSIHQTLLRTTFPLTPLFYCRSQGKSTRLEIRVLFRTLSIAQGFCM